MPEVWRYRALQSNCKGLAKGKKPKKKSDNKVAAINATVGAESNEAVAEEQEGSLGMLSGSWLLVNVGLGTPCQEMATMGARGLRVRVVSGSRRKVPHHVYRDGIWRVSDMEPHGKVDLRLQVLQSAYRELRLMDLGKSSPVEVTALADAGAQMCLAYVTVARKLGLVEDDLLEPDNSRMEVAGAGFLTVSLGGRSTRQMVYFAQGVGEFYLSKGACQALGLVGAEFPEVQEPEPLQKEHQGEVYVRGGYPYDSNAGLRYSAFPCAPGPVPSVPPLVPVLGGQPGSSAVTSAPAAAMRSGQGDCLGQRQREMGRYLSGMLGVGSWLRVVV